MNIVQVRRYALLLPEVTEEPHFNYSSFRVRGKIFVTVPPEQTHIHVFVDEAQRELALLLEPEWIDKLLWGGKVVGLRVALAQARPKFVQDLIRNAWARKAPKALVTQAGH
jgi:hypothetical protein